MCMNRGEPCPSIPFSHATDAHTPTVTHTRRNAGGLRLRGARAEAAVRAEQVGGDAGAQGRAGHQGGPHEGAFLARICVKSVCDLDDVCLFLVVVES